MNAFRSIALIILLFSTATVLAQKIRVYSLASKGYISVEKVKKTDDEWRKVLTPEQFEVTRRRGTERACSGAYWAHHEGGTYSCVCCGLDLFSSNTKFDSGTGWPSFFQPVAKENVIWRKSDRSFGMVRTEILCAKCDAHLGHVFEDGPAAHGPAVLPEFACAEVHPGPRNPEIACFPLEVWRVATVDAERYLFVRSHTSIPGPTIATQEDTFYIQPNFLVHP